jgi:putative transferase (TIGR04331 family)
MNFYKYLPENVKNRLLVRLYPGAFGERYRSQWEQQSPPARIDDGTNSFDKVLDQCSIFTTDHLSTTWLQAMSKNIPTVIFIDFDQYDFAPEALAWMATLQDVGILHRSSKSAADHIVMIQNEPRKWWDAKQTQETLAAFLNVFAMDSEDAIEVWAAELVGLRAAAATRKPPSEQGLSV